MLKIGFINYYDYVIWLCSTFLNLLFVVLIIKLFATVKLMETNCKNLIFNYLFCFIHMHWFYMVNIGLS